MELLVQNSEWQIAKTTVAKNIKYYGCCSAAYPDVTVDIILKRNSPSYKALIVTPAFGINPK